ncbi:MAG: type 1 glutamine amidotransferase [Fimbriimonadaceae bacterium]|nr:type 1 glutamine amidotransferase [Fimbriimonadaceae bacterium]
MAGVQLGALRIASLVEESFEDNELWYPTYLVRSLGCEVPLVGVQAGDRYHGKYGVPAVADLGLAELDPDVFQGVLIPGGWAPDRLRRHDAVKAFVKAMDDQGKLVAHICHAGWVVASAGICRGRTMTSTPGIRDDLVNAGATWVDAECCVDRNMISSRRPDDLPAYGNAIGEFLARWAESNLR